MSPTAERSLPESEAQDQGECIV